MSGREEISKKNIVLGHQCFIAEKIVMVAIHGHFSVYRLLSSDDKLLNG